MGVLVFGSYFGIVILEPQMARGQSFVDVFLSLLIAGGALGMLTYRSPAVGLFRRCFPWIWLILLGSLIALFGVGFAGWAVIGLGRGLFAMALLFVAFHVLVTKRLLSVALVATWTAWLFTVVSLALATGYRPRGYFPHPNYPAHYVVLAGAVLFMTTRRTGLRVLILVGIAVVLYKTSSFGGLLLAVALVVTALVRAIGRQGVALGIVGVSCVALALVVSSGPDIHQGTVVTFATGEDGAISDERLERSQEGRITLWTDTIAAFMERPWGLGPGGVKEQGIARLADRSKQPHSDLLGHLVERGVLGVIGLIGLWFAIWRFARPGGVARLLIPAILVAGLMRDTMTYRHVWLLLALALAYDYVHERRRSGPDASEEGDLDDGRGGETELGSDTPRPAV